MSDVRRRRPWLAVLLAVLVSGLGHAYLRRWGRAFAWYVGITATLVLFVPDAALDQLFAREVPPLLDVAPALVVIAASIVDAYVIAVRNNRKYERQQREKAPETGSVGEDGVGAADTGSGSRSAPTIGGDADSAGSPGFDDGTVASTERSDDAAAPTIDCPHCGRETDAEIDFCHWCTEPLDHAPADTTDSGSSHG